MWNLVIVVLLVVLHDHYRDGNRLYAYAIAWLVATVVQLLLVASALRRIDFRLQFSIDWRDPRVRQVFTLMLPVTIGLGIVNLDQLLNSVFGTLVSPQAPRAIDNAFRIYMLPQGVFSVAVATVLFPTLSRQAARRDVGGMRRAVGNGMRQINLLLIPAAAMLIVLATPITRLVFQRGEFNAHSTHLVSVALFWFAFSLPFGGINLLLTRTFFAVQRPWIPTRLAALNMIVDMIVSVALYKPLGIAGLVIGTAAANAVMTVLQLRRLRAGFNGRLEGAQTLMITVRDPGRLGAARRPSPGWCGKASTRSSAPRCRRRSSRWAWRIAAGAALYGKVVLAMRIPEARQIEALVMARLRRELMRRSGEPLSTPPVRSPSRAPVSELPSASPPRSPARAAITHAIRAGRRAVSQHQRRWHAHPPQHLRDLRPARLRLHLDATCGPPACHPVGLAHRRGHLRRSPPRSPWTSSRCGSTSTTTTGTSRVANRSMPWPSSAGCWE